MRLTKEQQSLLDREAIEAAEDRYPDRTLTVNRRLHVNGYLAGAESILSDPGKWGLVQSNFYHASWTKRDVLQAENQRLREALGKIAEKAEFSSDYTSLELSVIAKQALEDKK